MNSDDLKAKIPSLLSGEEFLRQSQEEPQGVATGIRDLDERLFEHGLPRGGLTLIVSSPGLGATSFWLEMCRRLGQQKRWSLWISPRTTLFAQALWARGVSLSHLYVLKAPDAKRDLQFALRECLDSAVFTLIGYEIASLRGRARELPILKNRAEKTQAALVFLSIDPLDLKRTQLFNCVIEMKSRDLIVHKSKSRPSFTISWRGSYANLLSKFSPTSSPAIGRSFSELHATSAPASEGGTALWRHPPNPVAFQKLKKFA